MAARHRKGRVAPVKKTSKRPKTGDIRRLKGMVTPPAVLPSKLHESLDDLCRELSLVVSLVNVCYATLEEQRCGRDLDVACVLRQCVSNSLFTHVQQLRRLTNRVDDVDDPQS
jgi:hypothetical protein